MSHQLAIVYRISVVVDARIHRDTSSTSIPVMRRKLGRAA